MLGDLRVKINNRISELCGVEVTPKRPYSDSERFFIRIARPQSENTFFDNNPPHKDIYLDRLRNAVNIYFPIIGSNEKSSLGIIPYSHMWKENEIKKIVIWSVRIIILPNGKNVNADTEQEPVSDEFYFIVTDKCTECKGFHDEPQCAAVCPVDCCVPDEDNVESEEVLLSKQKFMHPE